jgi:hypothetical protein
VVAINPNMLRPLLYALVNVPYFVLSSIAISVVLLLLCSGRAQAAGPQPAQSPTAWSASASDHNTAHPLNNQEQRWELW